MNEIQKSILESFELIADASIKNSVSTTTIEAEIVAIEDSGLNSYIIQYMGTKFKAYANNQSVQYSAGDKVYVLVPNGDFTKEKMIIGATTPSGNMYAASNEVFSNYLEKSDNLLTDVESVELSTYKTEEKAVPFSIGNFNAILTKYLKTYHTLEFSCKLKTIIPLEQRVKGNYGLKLRLYFNVTNKDGSVSALPRDYIIDVNNMLGNPYGFEVWTTQKFYIAIPENDVLSMNYQPELLAFVKDFPLQDTSGQNDIFINNINLKVVDTLTAADMNGYYLSITAEQGEFFFANQYKDTKKLTPILKINGKDTTLKNSQCYWFVEDNSIDETSDYYLSRGGRGWKCLNDKKSVEELGTGVVTYQYNTQMYEYTINKSDVQKTLRYKCVVIYNDTTLSQVITIENLDANTEVNLITSTGSNLYVKDIGEVHLICRVFYDGVTNSDAAAGTLSYTWTRMNRNEVFLDNDFYELVRLNEQININNKLYYETEIKFPTAIIDEINIVNCTVKLAQTVNSKFTEGAVSTERISLSTAADYTYLLSIQNGDIVYKYDADGDSPMVANYDGPESSIVQSIKPLSFKMFKQDGTELTEDEYAFCETYWSIPKNSMINLDRENNIIDNGEHDSYFHVEGRGKVELSYSIIHQFNSSRSDNTVFLRVKFDGTTVNASTNINFLKDGASGTNGTKYTAIIKQDGYAYREKDVNGNYRKLQLVYINGSGWKRYDIDSKFLLNFDNPQFEVLVYKDGELLQNYNEDLIKWSIFDEKATDPCFSIENKTLSIITNWTDPTNIYCNIIQAKISISENQSAVGADEYIYAYYPIEITYLHSSSMASEIIPNLDGGFSSVLYAADGTNPRYDTTFNFKCIDNLYQDDQNNVYDYHWSTSDNLKHVEIVGNECRITPKEKYDTGESKNYVKVALNVSAEKKAEANAIAAKHQAKVTEYTNLINYYTNQRTYLTNLLTQFTYGEWLAYLKGKRRHNPGQKDEMGVIGPFYDVVSVRAYKLKIVEELFLKLDNFYNFCESKGAKISEYFDYLNVYNTLKNLLLEVENKLLTYDYKAWTSTINSNGYQISYLGSVSDNLKSSLGINSYIILQTLVNEYNDFLAYYDKQNVPIFGDNIRFEPPSGFTRFRQDLTNYIINNKNFTNLRIDSQGNVIDSDFQNLYLDIIALNNSLVDKELKIYTYDEIYQQVMLPLKHKLEVYANVNEEEETASTRNDLVGSKLNDFYIKYYEDIIKKYTDLKNKELVDYNYYIKIKQNTVDNSIVHIRPIIMTYNRYEMSAINGWDGNKLYTGANNEGDYLFAPQIGAGRKEEDNSFTGMVMGLRKRHLEVGSTMDVGLFGYYQGLETMFLNAEDGSAYFGAPGKGQIIIKPASADNVAATIYGGNYIEGESGLLIDLTTPAIKFGSGNFEVTPEGYLTAKGGGSIAGWEIGETTLRSSDLTITLDALNKCIYSDLHRTLGSTGAGFYLGPDGMSVGSSIRIMDSEMYIGQMNGRRWVVTAKNNQSYIAYNTDGLANPGYLKSDSVYIGTDGISLGKHFKVEKSGMGHFGHLDGKHWKIYANNMNGESYIFYGSDGTIPVLNAERNSVYIGTDGIGLGYYFRVNNEGTIKAGNINSDKHWTITSKGDNGDAYIAYNTDTFNNDTASVYIGTDGISLGKDKFSVTNRGNLIANEGIIAGWAFNDNYFMGIKENGKGIKLSTNGSIEGGIFSEDNKLDTSQNYWQINRDGSAIFNNIQAKGGKIAGWIINSNSLQAGNILLKSDGSIAGGLDTKVWAINSDGSATFTNASITGGSIKLGDVEITQDNITIKGAATNGTSSIAGWKVKDNKITRNSVGISWDEGNYAFWAGGTESGTDPSAGKYQDSHKPVFSVTQKGVVNATAGTIGKWSIKEDGSLYSSSSPIEIYLKPMYTGGATQPQIAIINQGSEVLGLCNDGAINCSTINARSVITCAGLTSNGTVNVNGTLKINGEDVSTNLQNINTKFSSIDTSINNINNRISPIVVDEGHYCFYSGGYIGNSSGNRVTIGDIIGCVKAWKNS